MAVATILQNLMSGMCFTTTWTTGSETVHLLHLREKANGRITGSKAATGPCGISMCLMSGLGAGSGLELPCRFISHGSFAYHSIEMDN
jgi:hypothetical protein